MADYGIKFTRDGYNARGDNDERHMSLWTKFKLYKIQSVGSGTVSNNGVITIQGGRNYNIGVKDTTNNRWYMAGATGPNNAGFAGQSAKDNSILGAPSTVYGNVPFAWTMTVTGTNLPFYFYYTIDTL